VPLPSVSKSFKETLKNWERSSQYQWKSIILRTWRLGEEIKFNYTTDRIMLLLCREQNPMLRALPKEIIKHVCSFLVPTYRGCTAFGFQRSGSCKWQHLSTSGLLDLDTDSHTYTLLLKSSQSAWTSSNFLNIMCKGTWSVRGVDIILKETTREISGENNSKEQTKKKFVAPLKRNNLHGLCLVIPNICETVSNDLIQSIWPEISRFEVNLLNSDDRTDVPIYY